MGTKLLEASPWILLGLALAYFVGSAVSEGFTAFAAFQNAFGQVTTH